MGFQETQLRAALRAVAGQHPASGWRKVRWHLLAQPEWGGVALNRKRVCRLWRDEGLTCKSRARKKRRTGPGAGEQKRLTAQYPMHVVSFDFQSDVTSCGRHIRFFNVIDEYTRTALAIIPRRSFKATDVVAVLGAESPRRRGTSGRRPRAGRIGHHSRPRIPDLRPQRGVRRRSQIMRPRGHPAAEAWLPLTGGSRTQGRRRGQRP